MDSMSYDFLFIDEDKKVLKQLEEIAQLNHWTYLSLTSGSVALEHLTRFRFHVIVVEVSIPKFSGLQILEWVKTLPQTPEVIVITSKGSIESAVSALKLGAFDYLTKPFEVEEKVIYCMRHALEKYELIHKIQMAPDAKEIEFENIVGRSPKMQAIFEMMRTVARSNSNILILGESGTGKEVVVRAICRSGSRAHLPFVVINCAAMPDTLLESELFGYVKGAFTGATTDKEGLFEVANGGTVFLDEIGEIPMSTQVKLLRVLQEGEIRRIGDTNARYVDVRIIAATNKDLAKQIEENKFREDLYYRLNVINITLPPLRERNEDVLPLAYYFLKKYSGKMEQMVNKISIDALQALQNYSWPGNVRELENVIERAVVLTSGDTIMAKNIPSRILSSAFYNIPETEDDLSQLSYKEAKKRALNNFDRSYIMHLLEKTAGNITAAAEKAEMDRSNFRKIIRKCGVSVK